MGSRNERLMPTTSEIRGGFNAALAAAQVIIDEPTSTPTEVADAKALARSLRQGRQRWRSGAEIVDDIGNAWTYFETEPVATLDLADFQSAIATILGELPGMVWTGNNQRRQLRQRLRELVVDALTPQPIKDQCERIKRTMLVSQDQSTPPLLKFDQGATDPIESFGDAAVASLTVATTPAEVSAAFEALSAYYEMSPDEPDPQPLSPQ